MYSTTAIVRTRTKHDHASRNISVSALPRLFFFFFFLQQTTFPTMLAAHPAAPATATTCPALVTHPSTAALPKKATLPQPSSPVPSPSTPPNQNQHAYPTNAAYSSGLATPATVLKRPSPRHVRLGSGPNSSQSEMTTSAGAGSPCAVGADLASLFFSPGLQAPILLSVVDNGYRVMRNLG